MTILFAALLATALTAQQQSGRHFQRPSRTVATPATAPVVEAAAKTAVRVEPLRRLRSGRAWSTHHFSRRAEPTAPRTNAVEASQRPGVRRSAVWGRHLRGV
ncbi:MAG: hypothetical protein U1E73_02140 [Planctomycetota bacterium]